MKDDRSDDAERLLERIGDAGQAGVDLIQIRERLLPAAALLRFARRAVTAAGPARVVVNERADAALAAGAAGVHLRGDSMPARRLRAVLPAAFLVGRSVHSEEEAILVALGGGVDYLVFGTVFPSASKPAGHRASGVEALGRVAAAVRVPVIAIGGITPERVPGVLAAGAAGVAAIEMFRGTAPIAPLVGALRSSC